MGAISKAVKKIIPKEIRPILPFAVATFGGPIAGSLLGKVGLGATGGIFGSGAAGQFLGKGLASGLTNVATQALMGDKISPRSALMSGIMSGTGGFLRNSLGETAFGQKLAPSTLEALQGVGQVLDPAEITEEGYSLTGTGEGLSPITRPGYAALTVGSAEAAYQTAEEEQRKFEEEQAASEASQQADMASRAEYLRNYAELAGYSQEEINDLLDRYGYSGYKMGGRVGYRIGGGPVKSFIAKMLNVEPSEEVLNKMFEERKKEIFNSMFDPDAGTGAYSMKQMQEADKIATEQAMKELEEYKMRIGIDMENPPEGTVGDSVIDQIMEPREKSNRTPGERARDMIMEYDSPVPMNTGDTLIDKFMLEDFLNSIQKGREERNRSANGGRIKKSIGGLAFAYNDYLRQADELGLSGDPMSFEDFTDTWLELQSDLGNTEKYKEGGMINMKMGGMPAEMDLRGGGFVPIGAKERADDVPARLSKNEFVMTADAVRAAGGGSVNKGAKRMYDLMNKLEARV